jgi:hypothetical protein
MASPGCDCTVLPVRNRGEISSLGNAGASQGGRSLFKKRISPDHKKSKLIKIQRIKKDHKQRETPGPEYRPYSI